MLNWMGTQKTADATTLLKDVHEVIAALPADDAVEAVTQITAALEAINCSATLTLEERYDDIYLLDAAVVARTRTLLREYLNTSRQTRSREAALWNGAYNCWSELATAYVICVQRYADDAANATVFKKLARVAVARAMRALRRQLQWLRIRYAAPVPAIWIGLVNLYSYIEAENIDEEMLIYPGETSTIKREFLKVLIQSSLSCENLQPPGQDLATFIVNRYSPHFVMSKTPDAGCTHWFDLKHPQPIARIGRTPSADADLRYFGAGAAVEMLGEALRFIEEAQEVPEDLGFTYGIELPFLTPVLTQIYQDWSGAPAARQHAREKSNARITVVPGFKEIIDLLESAADDPFDFTEKSNVESWVANDISSSGFAAVIPAVSGDWVSVGGIAGIESEIAGEWSVGMVRRVSRLDDGQQEIGVQLIARKAMAVRMMREDTSRTMRVTQRMPLDHAILLTADAAQQKGVEVLVRNATAYSTGNVHMLAGESVLLLQFNEVMEKNAVCARISFNVLGIES